MIGVSRERVRQILAAKQLKGYAVEGWLRLRLLRSDVEAFKRSRPTK
jgi:hypothetical protein